MCNDKEIAKIYGAVLNTIMCCLKKQKINGEKMPKVSVLMPVYKTNENYLREAISSFVR